ncbi:MAG: formylglycine-generating enzyme family protein, partial [bacterium]|nr:formylglycine-generating enzyme family protein [bacterium]
NTPVVSISWYEADAFVRWLNATMDDGRTYFLPDETGWEAASAGMDNRDYPWGKHWNDGACNTKECGMEKATSVGVFQHGNTPDGLVDMCGNVWEWTRTNYHSKTVSDDFLFDEKMWVLYLKWDRSEGDEKEELRKRIIAKLDEPDRQLPVLRGGSWYNDKDSSRSGGRYRHYPNFWLLNIGFRCCRT